jgi:hypothetical protein
VGRYCIVVHGTNPPAPDEWAELVEVQIGTPTDGVVRLLIVSDGGAPDASQRAMLNARARGLKMIAAVLTPSVIARAAALAIRLFHPEVRILPRHELVKALDHLDAPERDRVQLRNSLEEMQRDLALGGTPVRAP